jgi:hypothetical protein
MYHRSLTAKILSCEKAEEFQHYSQHKQMSLCTEEKWKDAETSHYIYDRDQLPPFEVHTLSHTYLAEQTVSQVIVYS